MHNGERIADRILVNACSKRKRDWNRIQERLIATLRKRHADISRWYSAILFNKGIHKGIGVDSRKGSYNRNVPGTPWGVRG